MHLINGRQTLKKKRKKEKWTTPFPTVKRRKFTFTVKSIFSFLKRIRICMFSIQPKMKITELNCFRVMPRSHLTLRIYHVSCPVFSHVRFGVQWSRQILQNNLRFFYWQYAWIPLSRSNHICSSIIAIVHLVNKAIYQSKTQWISNVET